MQDLLYQVYIGILGWLDELLTAGKEGERERGG